MAGFRINDKHTEDFGLILLSRDIGSPTKNKIKEKVPFMNGEYDFSLMYGEQTFGQRQLVYTFDVSHLTHELLMYKLSELENWLLGTTEVNLHDDDYPDTHFKAECIDVIRSDDDWIGEITVKFSAYPFRVSNENENDMWDIFNFETGVSQELTHNISNSKVIDIYNNGINKIYPIIVASGDMQLIMDNKTYNIKAGTTNTWLFAFKRGLNRITINGNGTIEFIFRKEQI